MWFTKNKKEPKTLGDLIEEVETAPPCTVDYSVSPKKEVVLIHHTLSFRDDGISVFELMEHFETHFLREYSEVKCIIDIADEYQDREAFNAVLDKRVLAIVAHKYSDVDSYPDQEALVLLLPHQQHHAYHADDGSIELHPKEEEKESEEQSEPRVHTQYDEEF